MVTAEAAPEVAFQATCTFDVLGEPMYRRTATAVVALTATAGLLAGCGGSSSGGANAPTSNDSSVSPATELTSAISALGQSSTLTASVKLGASGSQLLDFVHAQDKGASLTAAQANAIAGAAINFEVAAPSGQTLGDISGLSNSGAVNVSVVDSGKTWFSIRFVKQTLYLQVDLKDLLNTIGQAEAYRQLQGAGAQLPGFASALVQGKWVSLPLSTLKSLTSAIPGASGITSTPDAGQAHHLLDSIQTLLTKDVTVTRTSSGGTDTLTLTTNLRSFAGDLASTFKSVPGAGAALSKADLGDVPDKNISLVATVTSGALSSLTFDLGQLAKSGKGTLPLQLSFTRSGSDISAPSGAVAVDLTQLGSLLGAFSGGL